MDQLRDEVRFPLRLDQVNDTELLHVAGQAKPKQLHWAKRFLDASEKQYLSTLADERVACRFAFRRALLRVAIGAKLGVDALGIPFTRNAWGKPELASPLCGCRLWFNVSSSNDDVLIGLNHQRPIGVDLEHQRKLDDLESMAMTVLHPREWELWQALDESEKQQWFYKLWAIKEAVLKCIGCGLSVEPSLIRVNPRAREQIVIVPQLGGNSADVVVRQIDDCQGASAAIAWPLESHTFAP
jgi:4'-phosphopantetheinyl transferase